MNILLLGGTGAMGNHLAQILSDRGEQVVVTSRSNRQPNGLIEYKKGNAKNVLFLNTLLDEKKWDVIIDFMNYAVPEFKDRIDKLLNSTSQYIFLSSARVYDENQESLTEKSSRLLDTSMDNDYLDTSEYALSKARQEDILQSSNKKNWTIIRPYITYSETRLQLGTLEKENWLYRALHGRTIVFSEDIKNHFTTLTYGQDVAKGIADLINGNGSLGETFHITCNNAYKWIEILNIYLDILEKQLGKRPKVFFQNVSDFLDWYPGEYQVKYDRLFDRKFDNTKINMIINTEKFIDPKDGLKACLEYFIKNPEFKFIDWRLEAIKDRYTNERTPLNKIPTFKKQVKYILYRYIL